MKINNVKLSNTPYEDIVVIPRADNDIVFKVRAVLDYEPFEKMCPMPEPKMIQRPGQPYIPNFEDPKYKEALRNRFWKKRCWMILKSLQATEGLEFDVVNMEDPGTWEKWDEELKQSGFSIHEIDLLIDAIRTVNGMNEDKLDAARRRFLASQSVAPAP